jgi:NAD(P)H dehydrogenase (quinone)
MSANIAVIYNGVGLREVAEAIAAAAAELSARVRLLRVPESDGEHPEAAPADLEWADGIALGTPARLGYPAPELIRFLDLAEPLSRRDKLYDKVITTFTEEPERFAPESVTHPIWDALYRWGAVIVGPRASELELDARPQRTDEELATGLAGPRLRTAQYRGRRLAELAGLIAAEHSRRSQLEL